MSALNINKMTISSVLYLYTDRQGFFLDPDYQRQSDIWNLEKRQLLIDSIINGYDIPKLYFHKYPRPRSLRGRQYTHAIIDGKQRLESLWGFIDGDFALSGDAEYVRNPAIDIRGLTYKELGQKHPELKIKFDSFPLDIIVIETDDLELIEDMFSRLNEAVPLSAAEKRNALGGPIPPLVRRVCRHETFVRCLPFGNTRYRHFDLATKFFLIIEQDAVLDTKKVYLDEFVKAWKVRRDAEVKAIEGRTRSVLDAMASVFVKADPLLRSVGMVVLFFHLFRVASRDGWDGDIERDALAKFEKRRVKNRELAEKDLGAADYELLEFDRFTQTPNDAYATKYRLEVLCKKAFQRELPESERQKEKASMPEYAKPADVDTAP